MSMLFLDEAKVFFVGLHAQCFCHNLKRLFCHINGFEPFMSSLFFFSHLFSHYFMPSSCAHRLSFSSFASQSLHLISGDSLSL